MSVAHRASSRSPASLVELLRQRAGTQPDSRLYTFLEEDGSDSAMTHGELDRWARRIGEALTEVSRPGARVVLLYPPGLQYIAGFFGCLYSQRTAVPAYPPDPMRLGRTLPRLRKVIADAQATVVLTTSFIASFAEMLFEQAPELKELHWVATDTLPEPQGLDWQPPESASGTLAFLQYTSGSTGTPKGVMLSHGNLLHNLELIHRAFETRTDSSAIIWLPPYHDMGLIGGILQPFYAGYQAVLMSPLDFLKRPMMWLEAVSRFGGTVSGGPNFAFDLCVRKSTPEQRQALDLRRWEVAFSGAEPIRPETLARFAEAFAPSGFDPNAFYACYGLAEATLLVSGAKKGAPTVQRSFDAKALSLGQAVPGGSAQEQTLVGCGGVLPGEDIRIVSPSDGTPCAPGTIGEIWVSSHSVAQGYWARPEETARTFQARVAGAPQKTFLRTGDLGFFHEGQLFISGRLKDLIILRGRNIYPQDVELTVEQSHPAMRPGCSAAFSVDVEGEERLVIVQEVDPRKLTDPAEVTALVRQRLAELHEVQLHALVLIEPGSIPKTSSGKIQRHATRAGFSAGELAVVSAWQAEQQEALANGQDASVQDAPVLAAGASLEETTAWLRIRLARRLRVRHAELDAALPITSFGFDSLTALELGHELETDAGVAVRMEELLRGPTLTELARLLHQRRAAETAVQPPIPRRADGTPPLLSPAQERLWLLDRIEPGSALYNIAAAVRLKGSLNVPALERTFQDIVRRHEALRTTFRATDSEEPAVLVIAPDASFQLVTEDLRPRPSAEREQEVQRRASAEALLPFDLAHGPLLRAVLLRTHEDEHVLILTVHHIVSDGWSMSVLVREVAALYEAHTAGKPASLPALPIQYSDYGAWQRGRLQGGALEEHLRYWRGQLEGAPAVLDLAVANPRPPVSSHQGASVEVQWSAQLMDRVRALAREQGVSPFVVLLSAYQLLLSRYSGQEDLCVGAPIAGRDRSETQALVGFFVNTLVLRTRLTGVSTFRELLARVRDVTLEAYAHQELPFEKLVEALRPARHQGASPLFQVVLAIEPDPLTEHTLPGIELRRLELPNRLIANDLHLALSERAGGLSGRLEYSTDLFTGETARQLVTHLGRLLEAAVARPSAPLAELSLLDETERHQLLVDWSGTRAGEPEELCAHRLFEAQASRTPEAVALTFEGTQLRYRELNAQANQLARLLRRRGVGPDVLVGLCLERSLDMVVGLLAILKAGGAYVPLDPTLPSERLAFILNDTRAPLVLTRRSLLTRLGESVGQALCLDDLAGEAARESAEDLAGGATSRNLAYVIYTSGSTGRPKGTLLEHRGLCNTARETLAVMQLGVDSRLLQFFALSFDAAVSDIFPPLLSGATLCLVPKEKLLPGAPLAETLREQAITVVTLTPSILAQLEPSEVPSLRTVLSAGEACPADLATRWAERVRFVNAYGPTEVTVCATLNPRMDPSRPTLGRPLAHVQVYVLDEAFQPVPVGVPGELCVAGVGLARGYLGRPELTAERFVPHPFSTTPGARLYRTGDRVRFLPDGGLEYVGRIDNQVKLRGYRIEPGEIEAVLRDQPGVREAAVILREDTPGNPRLVAYVVAPAEAVRELRGLLTGRLPEYMVPAAFVRLEALPLSHHGKLDHKALPPPEDGRSTLGREYTAPRTDTERKLAEIWEQVLQTGRVGLYDSFFELGGHSLMAARVIARIRSAFGVELPLRTLLIDAPNVAAMARRIDEATPSAKALPPLLRVPRTAPMPLSLAQERLWLADKLSPGSPIYNVPAALRMRGALHPPALTSALSGIVRRHEALRTVFREVDGNPVQVILPPGPVDVPLVDLSALPPQEAEAQARHLAREEAKHPFALEQGPLLRTLLIRLSGQEHVLCLTLHHIVSDGWSGGVFLRELAALYGAHSQGVPSSLPELAFQYADYAAWHRDWLQSGVLTENLAYWRQQLAEVPTLQFRTDAPRPPGERFHGGGQHFFLPGELATQLEALAQREGATLFMSLLAVFNVLLQRYTGQDDIAVGTDIANRGRDELEGLIGFFTNQLVLRTRMEGAPTFQELLGRVRQVALEAYEHQDTPFGRLVQELRTQRTATGQPLFQAKLVLENAPMPAMQLPGLTLELMEGESNGLARWDLLLIFVPGSEGLTVTAEYNTDVFDGEAMERLWEHFLVLARTVAAAPTRRIDTLPMLTGEEHRRLAAWNETPNRVQPGASVPARFEQRAELTPDAIAVTFEGRTLTYGELNRRANQLAHHLRGIGVGAGSRVALSLERSLEMVIGLLAILKAGGSYVPLDASYPAERVSFLLEEAQPAAIVTRSEIADELPAQWIQLVCVDTDQEAIARQPGHNPSHTVGPDSEAYVLFTSGSTGTPKGVAVPHRGILRLVLEPGYVRLSPEETLLQLAPLAFDASTFEIWGALLNGGRLVLAPPTPPSLDGLGELIQREQVNTLWLTAGLFHQLVDSHLGVLAPVRQLLAGGDVLSPPHVAQVLEAHPACRVINGYGPTENTTFTCCFPVTRREELRSSVPLGHPIPGTRVYVLNAALEQVPIGSPGELYAAGDGLAHGYLHQPELTAERFLPNPFSGTPGDRMYRTGDLCRMRRDGTLEFLGRVDNQVKVRGFRIEPGEIESALRRHPAVQDAAVTVHEIAGEKSLVAYVTLAEDETLAIDGMKEFLSDKLPSYMVPAVLVVMEALPLTVNGKVDRRALPAPDGSRPELGKAYEAPRTPAEKILAAVGSEVLGVETVGIDDSFFDLGGDSIRAIQFVARCRERGLELSVSTLLEKQTVRAIAESIQDAAPVSTVSYEPFALVSPADRARLPADAVEAYPLAVLQAGMLFQSEYSQETALYHDAFSFHLELDADAGTLRQVLRELSQRHAVLRTSFDLARYGIPLQVVHREVEVPLHEEDLTHLSQAEQSAFLVQWLEQERSRPFTWDRAPLIRFALHRRSARTAQLSVIFHHAILDGWSFASLLAELFPRYLAARRGSALPVDPLAASYRDFVALERQTSESADAQRYWSEQLAQMSRAGSASAGRRRPVTEGSSPLLFREIPLAEEVSRGLRALAHQAGAPLKNVLLAAHLRVRSLLDGSPEVVTGFVSNGRPEVEDGERVLGLFLNSVPFCMRLGGGTWVELVQDVVAQERGLMPHRRYPMARLRQQLGGQPLFETLFNFVHFHVSEGLSHIEGVRLVEPYQETSWLDLPLDTTFSVNPESQSLKLTLRSNGREWDAAQLDEIAGYYLRTLSEMALRPEGRYEQLPLLGAQEKQQLLTEWNATRTAPRAHTDVRALFEAQAGRTPDAIAVEFSGQTLSYRELNARANQLARHLQRLGVGPEVRVGLALQRRLDMVVGLLGILKAGGAYVPLDPSYPTERLAYILESSGARALVEHASIREQLPRTELPRVCLDEVDLSQEDTGNLGVPLDSGSLAYVLYTSGSTGKPKGVMVTHGGAVNYLVWSSEAYEAAGGEGAPVHSPLGFDLTITSLLTPLMTGGRAVLVPEGKGGEALANVLRTGSNYSIVKLTPTQLSLLELQLRDVDVAGKVRCFVIGGEALTSAMLAPWRERAPGTRFINEYGPTETVVGCSIHEVRPGEALSGSVSVSIGRPIANTALYVLDAHGQPTPRGVPGELYVGGAGVARGYVNRPELTAERFVPDPFSLEPGQRLYRTGDVARWSEHGALEYLGRRDEQVKIRGFRIELGEVESVLGEHPAVKEAAVVVRQEGAERRLVGYVASQGPAPTASELREHLLTRLPEYMVPSAFVTLERLPLTPNGKVDRKALPTPEGERTAEGHYVAPRTPTEELLAGVLALVLDMPRMGIHDDFFLRGGHSLLAMQAIVRIRDAFQAEVSVRDFFEAPTVARLAERVERSRRESQGASRPPLVRIPRGGALPLSFAQHRLWFLEQFGQGNASYNIPAAMRIEGALDATALERSFQEVVRRHEPLRTTFRAEQGKPILVISPTAEVPLHQVDLRHLPESTREAELRKLAATEAQAPFNLERGPLLRVTLVRMEEQVHALLVTMHHIVSDGWSTGVLIREVAALYESFSTGKPSPLPELPLQYVDYADWQQRWLESGTLESELSYWKQTLTGAPHLLELPTSRPRRAEQSYRGAIHWVALPKDLSEALLRLSQREGVTPFMLLLAAFQVLLGRYAGQDDVSVGTPIAGRNRQETEPLIGFFVNTLVLRTQLHGEPSFRELLSRVRDTTLGAYAHQDLPFEKLVEALQPQRDLSRSPLFQVMFALQNAPQADISLPGLVLRDMKSESGSAKFDLTLALTHTPEGFSGMLEYNTDLFDADVISRMAGNLRVLLEGIVAEPGQAISLLPLVTGEERQQILQQWNAPSHFPGKQGLHSLFEAQVQRAPDARALTFAGAHLTYQELNHRANQLAHFLIKRGVGPESLVGLCVERSLEMAVGILAILKAGGAYVPLDPAYPADRLAFMVQDAGVKVLLTQQPLRGLLPGSAETVCLDSDGPLIAREPGTNPAVPVPPEALAYVIYTSGSTGRPKGTQIAHEQVARLFTATEPWYHFGPEDVWTLFHSYAFDFSVWELWGALLYGGRVVVVPYWVSRSPEAFHALLREERVTVLNQTPSAFRQLIQLEETTGRGEGLSLKWVIFGGEALEFASLRPWFARHGDQQPKLVNMYGITETTVHVTFRPVSAADAEGASGSIVGVPIPDLQAYVLSPRLQLLPVGVPGELYIGGAGLARGYLQRPELTAQRFIPHPFGTEPGARLYRTGDKGRYQPDGSIEYLGRLDTQVKVRGFRIELGEVEAALAQHPEVAEVIVLAREDVPGDKRLVAYIVGKNAALGATVLREQVRARLPEYMVPAAFVFLKSLPLTANGKVDRKALPVPDGQQPDANAFVAPRTPAEELIAGIFAQVVGVERVGAEDSFFDIGGHSLLATQVMSRLRSAFQVELALKELFQAPTVHALAKRVEAAASEQGKPQAPPIQVVPRSGPLPMSYAQQRLWFLDRLEPGSALYNISKAVRLTGSLDASALERSLQEIVRRHEALRTTFRLEGGTPSQIVSEAAELTLKRIRLEGTPAEREQAVRGHYAEEASAPFDLANDVLLRAVLLELAEDQHVLVLTMHHIVSDGWSVGLLVKEVTALYEAFQQNQPSPLEALPLQYADYALWQRQWLQSGVLETQLDYWKKHLEGAPQALDLPTDRPRPPIQTFDAASHPVRWSRALSERVKTLSLEERVTPFMLLLAAFQSLLGRYSGQDDVCIGAPIAGRNRQETEPLIGFFVNTLVLRTHLHGEPSFRELLSRVRDTTLGAYAHQDLPFEKLVEALQPQRDLSRSPLFQVMFALQNAPALSAKMPGLTVTPIDEEMPSARFDLTLTLQEEDGVYTGALVYNTRLFDSATIRRMETHLVSLLEAVLADPERRPASVPLLSAAERRQVLTEWNATDTAFPTGCAHELVAAQAAKTPDAIAVMFQDQRLTYAELERRANHLAHTLVGLGVGPEVRVGLCVERTPELAVSILAVLKAGGAYVPLDPSYPRDRLAFMLADSGAQVLVLQQHLAKEVAAPGLKVHVLKEGAAAREDVMDAPPRTQTIPSNLAYVIYTSGSTGRPKGTLLTHRGLCNTALAAVKEHGFHPGSRVLQFAAIGFDASVCEIFGALLAGATLCLAPRETLLPGPPLRAVLTDNAITAVTLTPSVLAQLEPDGLPALKTVISAGEACPPEVARKWSNGRKLLNAYGPTEVTICASINGDLNPERPTIGRPFPNVRVYVLDASLSPVPVGVAGELYVGGPGVARGYVGRPELTAERFVPDLFGATPGERLYRTGDIVRWRADGELEYFGRTDGQVKLRGFRIELGEVESVLREHPAVKDVAVIARDDGGTRRLVGYIVSEGQAPEATELRSFLLARLPPYMVPAMFVSLEALPLSSSGKLDRKALPAPDASAQQMNLSASYEAPRSDIEKTLAAIWQEVLNVPRVGLNDGFFELGGNSLMLVQIHSKLRAALGVDVPLIELFQHRSLSALAAHLRREEAATADPAADEERFDTRRALRSRQQTRRRGRTEPSDSEVDGDPEDSND
ncbi:non-ribosomal peptide synthase/polyketide synthase [Stigmatella hybrida]|uniref:non-ribosomal peptide synthase/polyketide synthase n=1 Tax=Stigmatella hybrida TaxID=394097 RepID=UPI001CDB00ED|nr:non-ribosomal peptide synthase/polyketide synthase [Stigmatella hybrida]